MQKAQRAHLKLLSVEVRDVKEFDRGFALLVKQRPGALLLTADPMILFYIGRMIEFTAKHQLPAIYNTKESVMAGGLMSYDANQPELYKQAATYVDISKHAGRVNGESIVVEQLAARSSAHLLGWTTARIPRYALGGERRS